jgi:hypothetical protein
MANKFPVSFGNIVLYEMCRNQPLHSKPPKDKKQLDIIASKLWIIGRSYAAAIERGAGDEIEEGQDFYLTKVAPAIYDSPIDEWIASVKHIERLTKENFVDSLRCHKNVMDLFAKIAGGTTKRSLASKYLHFHNPDAFFIYDSRAKKGVTEKFPGKHKYFDRSRSGCDEEYQVFCCRCLHFRDELEKEYGEGISPRDLDSKLLNFQF